MEELGLFWFRTNNFGDALNPVLYKAITGRSPNYVGRNRSPKVLAIGSTMTWAKPGDTVWGAGCLNRTPLKCDHTTDIRAIRGPMTANMVMATNATVPEVYGDPALLLPMFFDLPLTNEYNYGFMPHYADQKRSFDLPPDVLRLRPMASVMETLVLILACKAVVSSSLHGIVVAEAYGIPAVWVKLSNKVNEFKFRDYYTGTGRRLPSPLDWRDGVKWDQVDEKLKTWQPPVFSAEDLLNCCPFEVTDDQ